jgi:hypothetical protein
MMSRAKTAAEARWLMKPNLSREGLSLEKAAKHVNLTPAELDLLLWETNGGFRTPKERGDAERRKRERAEREKYRVTTRKDFDKPKVEKEREERRPAFRDESGHFVGYDPSRADKVLKVFG